MKFLLSLLCLAALAPCVHAGETSLEVLEEINLARTCPRQYASLLIERMADQHSDETRRAVADAVQFLEKVKPLPPLDFSDGLMLSAQEHVTDQGAKGGVGHMGSDRSRPWDRIAKFGRWMGAAGENISYGHPDAKTIVATLITDAGVRDRGHRKNIFSPSFGVAGVACGKHARFGSMCVIDFAGGIARSDEPKVASSFSWSAFDSLRSRKN